MSLASHSLSGLLFCLPRSLHFGHSWLFPKHVMPFFCLCSGSSLCLECFPLRPWIIPSLPSKPFAKCYLFCETYPDPLIEFHCYFFLFSIVLLPSAYVYHLSPLARMYASLGQGTLSILLLCRCISSRQNKWYLSYS